MAEGVRNLDYIRALKVSDEKGRTVLDGARLYETISDIIQQHQATTQQGNHNPAGEPLPPPPIDGVNVTGQNGHFHIQIQHRAEIYRGIQYYAEFADNPGFSSPHTIHMGDSREHTQFLGNGTYYWRAFAAYASSPPSAPAYHGGAGSPQPVSGGGGVGGPALLAPQGSGTGIAGEGLSGPGPVPFRSSDGLPPKRGKTATTPAGSMPGSPLTPGPSTGLPAGMGSIVGSFQGGQPTNQMALYDTYANWTSANYPPAQLPLNTTFTITDRNYVTYIVKSVAGVNTWVYDSGVYSVAQASIPTTGFNGAALGANDTGLLIQVTDYHHVLSWGGAAWGFWGEDTSGQVVIGPPSGAAPNGGLWGLCDGSTYAVLQANGTTANVTTQNLTGDVFIKGAAAPGAQQAATVPTWQAGAKTDIGTAVIGVDSGAGTIVQAGVGTTVATHTHTHTDTGHQHGLSNANATLNTPSETNGGLPLRIACTFWIRR